VRACVRVCVSRRASVDSFNVKNADLPEVDLRKEGMPTGAIQEDCEGHNMHEA
jgi:hypothetical protein